MPDGFKTWSTGDVVTASEFNGYLMEQAVTVFADATARDAAITSPADGQVAFLTTPNTLTVYDGASWVDYASLVDLADLNNRSLDDLDDTSVSGPSTGEVLEWSGSAWVPGQNSADIGLNDVDTTTDTINPTTSATTVRTHQIAAGEPAAGDNYQFVAFGDYKNDSSASRTWQFELTLGGTTLLDTGSGQITIADTGTTRGSWKVVVDILFQSTTAQRVVGTLYMGTPNANNWRVAGQTNAEGSVVGFAAGTEDSSSALDIDLDVTSSAATATQEIRCRGSYLIRMV